ncbi:MAG: hypothetical protein KAI79_12280 [Bacteroidales bacterium]|nr:hypothetical protein [Bacteroidales bacterium]
MIVVHKQEVATWLLMDYQAKFHVLQEKIRLFEQKYNQSWNEFEQQVKTSKKEDFSYWDDYIEWKAYIKMFEDIIYKIKEIKHGNFEVA